MNEDGIIVGDVSTMLRLESRIKSFQKTSIVDGKKYRWRYTLIPYHAMAKLGFFYCPSRDPTTGKIHKDAVGCIYCRKVTHDFRECRSKKKDVIETLMRVLRQHLENHTPRCLLAHMKLKVLEDVLSEKGSVVWKQDEFLSDPLANKVQDLFRFTFEGNWQYNTENLGPERMARAGLVRYDSSFTAFEELFGEGSNDASYCIYCKKILGHWQPNDDPLREHFKGSSGGKCFFFTNIDKELVESLQQSVKIETEESSGDSEKDMAPHSQNRLKSDDGTLAEQFDDKPPERRRRKLKRNFTNLVSDGEFDSDPSFRLEEDKDLVLDFKGHKQRANEVERKNAILDDSKDEFSFSAQGHSTFEIPPPSSSSKIPVPSRHTKLSPSRPYSVPASNALSGPKSNINKVKRSLDNIPVDAILSSDSELDFMQARSPDMVEEKFTPSGKSPHRAFSQRGRNLSSLQRRKAL